MKKILLSISNFLLLSFGDAIGGQSLTINCPAGKFDGTWTGINQTLNAPAEPDTSVGWITSGEWNIDIQNTDVGGTVVFRTADGELSGRVVRDVSWADHKPFVIVDIGGYASTRLLTITLRPVYVVDTFVSTSYGVMVGSFLHRCSISQGAARRHNVRP